MKKNFQVEFNHNKILGCTLLVSYDFVITVGNLLSKYGHCHNFIMRNC